MAKSRTAPAVGARRRTDNRRCHWQGFEHDWQNGWNSDSGDDPTNGAEEVCSSYVLGSNDLTSSRHVDEWAIGSTNANVYQSASGNGGETVFVHVSNPQRKNWRKAVHEYRRTVCCGNRLDIDAKVAIIDALGQSLSILFSRQQPDPHPKSVSKLLFEPVPTLGGCNLSTDDLKLAKQAEDFIVCRWNRFVRHTSGPKISELGAMSASQITADMNTVRDVWWWFVTRQTSGTGWQHDPDFRDLTEPLCP